MSDKENYKKFISQVLPSKIATYMDIVLTQIYKRSCFMNAEATRSTGETRTELSGKISNKNSLMTDHVGWYERKTGFLLYNTAW